jgi:hypothetical protein
MRWLMLSAAISAATTGFFGYQGARGAEAELGSGPICDTPAQTEKYIKLGGGDEALAAINETEPNACSLLLIAFVRGKEVKEVPYRDHTYSLTEILVLGFNDGTWHELEPRVQYTLFLLAGENA